MERAPGTCIEGTVTFRDLLVLDAFGHVLPVETFIADGIRYWDALFAGDERLSTASQHAAQRDAPKWRWLGNRQPQHTRTGL